MKNVTDKAAYIKGLLEGMKLDTATNEGKLLSEIVHLLDDMAEEIRDLSESYEELSDYVDSIDEDLNELEEIFELDDDEDCDCCCDEDDEDFCDCDCDDCDDCCDCGCGCEEDDEDDEDMAYDNVFIECVCPSCKASFYARESEVEAGRKHICPHCKERVQVVPEYEAELPVAELADDEQD